MPQKYGYMANRENLMKDVLPPCLVCDDQRLSYSWTDYSGEGYCMRCGTPYQLKWGELKDGETYPRLNVRLNVVPVLREFFEETGKPNGLGRFVGWDQYPDQLEGRQAFNSWTQKNHPELMEKDL